MSSIEVSCGGKVHTVQVNDNETLLAALRKAGFSVPAACGGRGKCGKCRVKINGVQRLACKVIPTDGDTVELPEAAAGAILTDTVSIAAPKAAQSGMAAAVDLGTTTVAVRIYDLENAAELGTLSAWNAQAAYGGDVISRIRYTMDEPDGLHELSALVRRQTEELILDALADCGRDKAELRSVFLAGNTVMQHIFAGLPVRSIATAPFKPETLFEAPTGDTLLGAELSYAPCVAGYVGGDITAGLLASNLCSAGGSSLFLDIGTNGEMALVSGGRISCCAVASGPAFEGAGISCGMPALSGAVSHVRYDRGFLYDVIGAVEPVGICGSGLIDLAATLLGQLGISHADFPFSRDVLSQSYVYPSAQHAWAEGFCMVDSTGYSVVDIHTQRTVSSVTLHPCDTLAASRRERAAKAFLQTAYRHFEER